jgi:hypothetical protein
VWKSSEEAVKCTIYEAIAVLSSTIAEMMESIAVHLSSIAEIPSSIAVFRLYIAVPDLIIPDAMLCVVTFFVSYEESYSK